MRKLIGVTVVCALLMVSIRANALDGESTYKTVCFVCHQTGAAGAPRLGDATTWAPRMAQGMATLQSHAIMGYAGKSGMMPAKGGNPSLPDADVVAAVEYMVNLSKGEAIATPLPVSSSGKGESTYKTVCFVCHQTGAAGAPILGDATAWARRMAQGMATLQSHAIKGYTGKTGMMPAKGGNPYVSDADVAAAVEYMVNRSKGPDTIPAPYVSGDTETPVRLEYLGDNWHYQRDADKLSVIRPAMMSVELDPDPGKGNRAPFCRTFKMDFLAGKFQVIEPGFQILSLQDPRYDERWERCVGIDRDESKAITDDRVFTGLPYFQFTSTSKAELPYRFYRIPINTKGKNKFADVVEFRFDQELTGRGTDMSIGTWKVSGYDQGYLWVDFQGCEIRGYAFVGSAQSSEPDMHDALSMLIRYQGRAMVLSYNDYPSYGYYTHHIKAKPGDTEFFEIWLTDLSHDQDFCIWLSPTPSEHVPQN